MSCLAHMQSAPDSNIRASQNALVSAASQLIPKMGALGLVPSDDLRADKASSSSKLGESSSSTAFFSEMSDEPQPEVKTQQQSFHQSWHGARHRNDSPKPFVATIEPIDTTPEERARNILCQKVLMLAAQLFPEAGCSEDLQVEHVGAGSFHDVVGFTVPLLKLVAGDSNGEHNGGRFTIEQEKYVVRVPRPDRTDHPNVDMQRNIAILRGLEGKPNVSIPRIIALDVGKMNVLGAPYTLETRLRGHSLQDLVGDEITHEAQNVSSFEQVVQLVEDLAQVTAPYAGWIAEEYGEGIDRRLCSSRIPMRLFEFPFDASSLNEGADRAPLTFLLKLVDLEVEYETVHCPHKDNYALWNRTKNILRSLQQRGFLGKTFHLCQGDLASQNILAKIVNDSSVEITGVVDWDFVCFAPKFCALRPPKDMWSGGEDIAVKECTKGLIDIFKKVASSEYVWYALSKEAKLGRKVWNTLREGMVGESRQWYAMSNIWMWERLHFEDDIGKLQ